MVVDDDDADDADGDDDDDADVNVNVNVNDGGEKIQTVAGPQHQRQAEDQRKEREDQSWAYSNH